MDYILVMQYQHKINVLGWYLANSITAYKFPHASLSPVPETYSKRVENPTEQDTFGAVLRTLELMHFIDSTFEHLRKTHNKMYKRFIPFYKATQQVFGMFARLDVVYLENNHDALVAQQKFVREYAIEDRQEVVDILSSDLAAGLDKFLPMVEQDVISYRYLVQLTMRFNMTTKLSELPAPMLGAIPHADTKDYIQCMKNEVSLGINRAHPYKELKNYGKIYFHGLFNALDDVVEESQNGHA